MTAREAARPLRRYRGRACGRLRYRPATPPSGTRPWDHPKTGKKIDFQELIGVLNEEAERLSRELGGAAKLMAKGLDLRPRLGTEKAVGA
jgi:hypothetical protein